MSQNIDSPNPSITLEHYEDISGEFTTKPAPLSPTSSIATLDAPKAPTEKEGDLEAETETETETETEAIEKDEEEPEDIDTHTNTGAMGSILLASGIVLAGLAIFLNKPIFVEHPWSRSSYF